jgi:peptide/nickel transport system substrate-binding protein
MSERKALHRRGCLAAATAQLAMPAIGGAAESKVLKFIPQADVAVVDPIWTTAYVTRNHAFTVWDTLYGQTGQRMASRPRCRWSKAMSFQMTAEPGP